MKLLVGRGSTISAAPERKALKKYFVYNLKNPLSFLTPYA
jgi:hypothetical protein